LKVGGHPALSLHSSDEPRELSQWLCHDDSTINIIIIITADRDTAVHLLAAGVCDAEHSVDAAITPVMHVREFITRALSRKMMLRTGPLYRLRSFSTAIETVTLFMHPSD